MNSTNPTMPAVSGNARIKQSIQAEDVEHIMNRYQYNSDIKDNIRNENLLPAALLSRLHNNYLQN